MVGICGMNSVTSGVTAKNAPSIPCYPNTSQQECHRWQSICSSFR